MTSHRKMGYTLLLSGRTGLDHFAAIGLNKFLAANRDVAWCFNTDSDRVAIKLYNCDGDVIANLKLLTELSAQDKHWETPQFRGV